MKNCKKILALLSVAALLLSLGGCGKTTATASEETAAANPFANYAQDNAALTFDSAKWNYDADNDVYWQVACSTARRRATRLTRRWVSTCPAPT